MAILLAAAPAVAANDRVLRAPVPDWVVPGELMPVPDGADGLVFVRRSESLVHLGAKGPVHYVASRIKILHPSALQLGNVSVAWNPAAGAPVVHVLQVHRDGQAVDVLKTASFEILRREDQLEAASLDGVLTAVLRVPDLRVGDEFEFAVTVPAGDPTLGANDTGLLALAHLTPPGRFRLGVSWDKGHKPNFKLTPDLTAVAKQSDGGLRIDLDNPDMLTPPQGAPARYNWQRVVEYSDFPDWAAVSRHFQPLYAKAAALDSGLKGEARRIAAAHPDPLSRAAAALKLVQQEVRYVYVGLDGGNLTPATAAQTWARRYGDCKAKTALLLGLLAELGIEAEPVVVSNSGGDDGLDQRLPSPRLFDHILVRARIGGTAYWLDGTLPPVAAPGTDPVIPYRWVLPLTAAGSALEGREWRPPATPEEVTLYEIDARAGFDKPARITTTTIIRGIKGLQQQAQFSGVTAAQLLAGVRQETAGGTWQTIEDVKWRFDPKAQASVLTISGMGTVDWEDDGGGAKGLALPGGGFSPPDKRVRPAGQNQDAPYSNEPIFDCHATTVRLPATTKPHQWSFNKGFDTRLFGRNYHRAFELRDGEIRMLRVSRVEQREIDAASAARDNGRIAAFNNSMANISFDPARKAAPAQPGGRVPATHEIDWTDPDVPCRSAGTTAASG